MRVASRALRRGAARRGGDVAVTVPPQDGDGDVAP
jgi:hypothetical protein